MILRNFKFNISEFTNNGIVTNLSILLTYPYLKNTRYDYKEVFVKFKNFLEGWGHLYETLAIKNILQGLEHL